MEWIYQWSQTLFSPHFLELVDKTDLKSTEAIRSPSATVRLRAIDV